MTLKTSGIRETIGKTIAGFVLMTDGKSPKNQVFIVFTDNTYYELYGDSINSVSGVDQGGMSEAEAYANMFEGLVRRVE